MKWCFSPVIVFLFLLDQLNYLFVYQSTCSVKEKSRPEHLMPLPIGRTEQWPYPQCRVIPIGYWLACFGLWCIVSYWGRPWWLLILCPQSGIKVHISSPLVLFSLGPQPLRWLSPVGFTSSVKLIWKHRHWEVMFPNLVRLTLKVHNHCAKNSVPPVGLQCCPSVQYL